MSDKEPLPPWEARDQRERRWMEVWVNARLEELEQADIEASVTRIIAASKIRMRCKRKGS